MTSRIAHLAHRSVRYFESGSGRPLVLLHAFPLSADQWLPQLHRVPPGWKFIAPDLRGFRGAGPAFEDPGAAGLSMDDYADDVVALLSHLEVPSAVVAGLSMGGYVAFAMLRRAPGRVGGLVLSNTRAAPDTADGRAGRDRMIGLATDEGPSRVAAEMMPRLLGESSRRGQPDLEDAVRRLILMNSADSIAVALAALRDRPDSTPLLQAIAVPTLVVAGDEDTVIAVGEAEAMHSAIRGSSLVVMKRVGHLSNLEDPVGWNRTLENWLAGI